ncbi:DUF3027 domain-containing protein [Arcanobacterium haemolyticum]|nr:DUF3027 domain-containing protein [Arcanobacterium haemolyticum]
MPEIARIHPVASAGKEKILAAAVEEARAALAELTRPENVGEHAGVVVEGDRLLTHCFVCLLPGYKGWFWTVALARIPRSSKVTVDEMALRPGDEALLAPAWVPWADRLEPADVQPSDRLPYNPNDPRLMESFEATDEDADAMDAFELGLGRQRVLSPQGRREAFDRWYNSDHGPKNAATRMARATCSTCGFLMLMGGSARTLFGVCANEWSPFDGQVISMDHGCGAHSETDTAPSTKMWDPSDPVVNEADLEVVSSKQTA